MIAAQRARRWGLVCVAVAASLLAAIPGHAQAFFLVDCAAGDTIQDAVDAAASGDEILVRGTCVEHVTVRLSLTIRGEGAANTAVVGNGGGSVFFFPTAATVTLRDMSIRGGNSNGAGVRIGASGVLDGLVIEGNDAGPFAGGGVYVTGSGVIRDTIIRDNMAGTGAGVYLAGGADLTVEDSTIQGNGSLGDAGGIFIHPTATATVSTSTISGNSAVENGGGIYNRGTLTLVDTVVEAPVTRVGQRPAANNGGGVYSNGVLTITGGTVGPNRAVDAGGGLFVAAGTLVMRDATVAGNEANDIGGGMVTSAPAVVTIERSTFSRNTSGQGGGGIANIDAMLTLSNVTVSGNQGAAGGGLAARGPTTLTHVTITDNVAASNGEGGGGLWVLLGSLPMEASILAGNTISSGLPSDCFASPGAQLISDGFNVMGAGVPGECRFTPAATDVVGTDPRLGPLQDNGSPFTHALLPGSPALELVPAPCSVSDDARKVVRPQGPACDAGALEVVRVADDVGLVDPTQGRWHLRDAGGGAVTSFFYGNPGDVPFMGDWDCDGVATPGLYRQSDGFAYLRNSNTVGVADISFFFGNPGDLPVAGDFDGDGCDTVSIYRSSEQRFYIINELGTDGGGLGAADFSFLFGNPGDAPVTGDWDGDGITEIGLFRETAGFFYYRFDLSTGIADDEFFFGDPGDRFVGGDWGVVDGKDSPAVFRGSAATFFFKNTLVTGPADSQFGFGEDGWLPVAGQFGL